jgi:dihydroorotase
VTLIADLVLANARAYVNKEIIDCSLAIDRGKILKIGKETNMPKTEAKIDLRKHLILPGLIDVHVHLRDEGKTYKEDFYTGTAAAAAGGITTVLDMPNNNPITMNVSALRKRMKIAKKKILVNVGFYSEFPENTNEIGAIAREGAVAFKLFMAEQVGGLNISDDSALLEAFRTVSKLKLLVAVHAEDKEALEKSRSKLRKANRNDATAYLEAHSENVEVKAIKRLLKIVEKTKARIHFCHVSSENGLKTIIDGKKKGLPITCEVTPHNLLLSTDDLRSIATVALTMPPVREIQHMKALWAGVKNGWVDIIASDHAPHTLKEKKADSIWDVKVGVPGLETMLPLLLTEVNRGNLTVTDVVRLISEKPAETFNLKDRGGLREGGSADLTVVDLKSEYVIDAAKFHSKARHSPFDGWKVRGKPVKTFVCGMLVMDDGEIVAKAGTGRIIRRGTGF